MVLAVIISTVIIIIAIIAYSIFLPKIKGAIGELKVVRELKKLTAFSTVHRINTFSGVFVTFDKVLSLGRKKTNKSVTAHPGTPTQVGVFLCHCDKNRQEKNLIHGYKILFKAKTSGNYIQYFFRRLLEGD